MARTIVLLALLAVLVTCQSQNPGCGSIDMIIAPLIPNPYYQNTIPHAVLQTPNARISTWFYDGDALAYSFSPFVVSTSQISYQNPFRMDAQMLDAARELFASNSTASRKIFYISAGNSVNAITFTGEDFSTLIVAARRLKQSGVEIHVIYDGSSTYKSFWEQVASPNALYVDNCATCGYYYDRFHSVIRGLTGMNSTGCAILGANPRVSTFDGNNYIFNGLGDYWFVRSSQTSNDGSQFGVQLRMAPCDLSNPDSGTCVRAAAVRTQNNNVINFYIDPATGLLTVTINGNVRSRDVNGLDTSVDGYYFNSNPISVPGTSDVGYSVTLYYSNSNDHRQFGFVLGAKMGVNAWAVLGDTDFGSAVGLCGTFDGCLSNDYYSFDQLYVNPGDSASNIYTYFSETWRVGNGESFFGSDDFDTNTYYYENYPGYAKSWNPRMDALAVTSDSAEACKFFSDKSKYLYEACTDSVAMSVPQYAGVAVGFYLTTCQTYCDYGTEYQFIEFAFIDEEECQAYCNELYHDWDMHAVYNNTNLPPYSVELQNTYGLTTQFSLGGTYTIGLISEYCNSEEVNATVTITCDESPVVDAGADRTISRTLYGWPSVYLIGSATDVNQAALDYSWKVIEAPLARNTTGYDGYLNPHGYDSPNDVNMDWYWTPYAILYPYYPGTYVVELAVFDGCSISYDTVTINVTCDNCAPAVTAYPAQSYFETTDSYGYSPVNLGSSAWNYQLYDYSNMQLQWSLDSTTTGLKLVKQDNSKLYYLNRVYTDNVLNTTTVVTNSTSSATANNNGIISDLGNLNRYEGHFVSKVVTSVLNVTTYTIVTLDSVDREVTNCVVNLYNPSSSTSSFYLTNVNSVPDFYPAAVCNGDYNFHVDYSDQCFDVTEKTTVTHNCAKSPVAQLVTCDPNWKYDYTQTQWPATFVQLDAKDSYSPSGSAVPLHYLYTVLSQPAWDDRDPELYVGTANTNQWFIPAAAGVPMLTQTASWDFQVSVRDDCSFSVSDKATVHLSCDDQSPVLTTSTTTIKSSDSSATFNQFTLNATGSSNPHNTISGYYINLVSGDPTGVSGLPYAGPIQTFALTAAGTYTFNVMTFDSCWWKNSSVVTVTYQCDATITPSVAITPSASAAYDTNTNTWPTFTLNGAASTINPNRNAFSWTVTTPSGVLVTGFPATNTLNLDTSLAAFRQVGAYVASFTITDGCKTVTTNYTVTVTCAALPTVTILTSATVTNGTNAATLTWYTSPQTAAGSWVVYNDNNVPVTSAFGANITFTATTLRTYTAVFSYGNGCQTASLNKTLSATCQWNPTFPLTTSTVTWTHNRFPKFSLAPTVTGENPDSPAYNVLAYTYRVMSAPTGSIWAPINSTVVYSNTTYVNASQSQVGDYWYRVSQQVVSTTTVTTTKVVTLVNGNEWFEGCFAADIAGDYTLQLTVTGYCSEYILSSVTVTAKCNTSPVAKTSYTQSVATGYIVTNPIVIDGLSSSDVDGDNLTYYWEVVSVPADSQYMLNDSNTQNLIQNRYLGRTQFAAAAGTYGLRLTVSDGCTNATSDLTVVVACNNNLAIANPQQSHAFDGFTPVSMSQFTFVTADRCDVNQNWDVIAFTPAEKVTPPPAPEPTSGSSQVAMSLFALFALIALLL